MLRDLAALVCRMLVEPGGCQQQPLSTARDPEQLREAGSRAMEGDRTGPMCLAEFLSLYAVPEPVSSPISSLLGSSSSPTEESSCCLTELLLKHHRERSPLHLRPTTGTCGSALLLARLQNTWRVQGPPPAGCVVACPLVANFSLPPIRPRYLQCQRAWPGCFSPALTPSLRSCCQAAAIARCTGTTQTMPSR